MNCGKVEEPSSSRSQYPSTARFAATSAILTVILSRSDRAPSSSTVSARPGWDADLGADECGSKPQVIRIDAGHVHLLRRENYRLPTATVGFNQPDSR